MNATGDEVPRAPRYESLDMWRGMACLMVLVNHAVVYQVPAGQPLSALEHSYVSIAAVAGRLWVGVPMFFVISGYCISATVDSHGRRGSSVATYFYRRFRRIFPPYWAVLLGIALIVGPGDVLFGGMFTDVGLLRPWWYSPAQWIGSISLTEIWRTHITGGQKALVLGPAWTLCYEEQFYAVCGALLFLWPRRFFAGAAWVTAGVLAIAVLTRASAINVDGFFFDGAWLQFALGILLYWALNYCGTSGRSAAALAFLTVIAVAGLQGPALLHLDKNWAQEFFVAGAFSLVALVLRPLDRRFIDSSTLRPLRVCGAMCYSLYLVHMPVTSVLRAIVQAAGENPMALPPFVSLPLYGVPSLLLAWQFHIYIERRFMSRSAPAPLAFAATAAV